jgi:DNA-binding cell septation regulator SpoVG
VKVTNANFRPYSRGKLIGFAEITLDDMLKITNMTVFNNDGKLSFSFPRKQGKDGWNDQIFVLKDDLKQEIRTALEKAVDFNETQPGAFDTDKNDDSDLPF